LSVKVLWLGLALMAVPGAAGVGLAIYESRISAPAIAGGVLALVFMALGARLVLRACHNIGRADAARHASEERFHFFVQAVTDYGIYMLDPRGYVSSWNAGAERIKGYAAEEIIGQHFSRFYAEEDRKAGAPEEALEKAARQGKYETEAWRVRKDGSRFWASVVIDPVRDSTGRLVGFAKVTRDITERLQHAEALEQTRAALAQSQKMEAIGQLSGGIAHDFNNLLHVIKNAADLIQQRLPAADPDVQRYVGMVKRNVERAAGLTQHLLAFSRRQPLAPKRIDANKTLSGVTELLHQALGEGIGIETALGSGVWPVFADPNQLETAILNLAINARDAMPAGGKLTIETSNAFLDETYAAAHHEVRPGQYAMIAVSDTGSGMTKEVVAKAFEPFFTTKGAGGSGLGLSQVFGFIKQSGGHVKIYSEPGDGTTVKIYLPRFAALESAETVAEAPPAPMEVGKETILAVEDDDDARAFTAEVLGDLGYRVLAASDARTALDLLEQEPKVDLLFTDVGLPNGINGRQLADEAHRRRPDLKVLFTTGYARNAIVHHGRLDRGVDLLMKPFSQADMAGKIRRALGR
jgi:PAS domain S-box-containing protein